MASYRRTAVSTLAAILIALILVSTFSGILLYLTSLQGEASQIGAGATEEISEKIRENLEAALWRCEQTTPNAYRFYINATNIGAVSLRVVGAMFVMDGGSSKYVGINPPVDMPMLAERTIQVDYSGSHPTGIGLVTERGNMFTVQNVQEIGESQPFNFEVTVTPEIDSTHAGGGASATVTVRLLSGSPQPVSLSASGLPSGASVSFTPQSSLPTYLSILIISTSTSTPAGIYIITITGAGGGLTRTATYTLTVTAEAAQVTFSASGLGVDASGAILTVDGVDYAYAGLPAAFNWPVGSSHSFEWSIYVSAGLGKRYAWASTRGLSTGRSGSITVPSGGGAVTAAYEIQYQLTASVSPPGAGSITLNPPPESDGYYDGGMNVAAAATANPGYMFDKWQLDGLDYSTSPSVTVTMDASHMLTAVFSGASYTLTIRVYREGDSAGVSGVTVIVDGSSYTTDSSGAASVTVTYGSHMVEVAASHQPSSDTRYIFTQWSDGVADGWRTVSVSSDMTLTAYMRREFYVTVQANPSSGGSTSPGSGWYAEGSTLTIQATPACGCIFNGWIGSGSGSYTGSSNPATVTVSGPITENAYFIADWSISASPNSGLTAPGGSVSATIIIQRDSSAPSDVPSPTVSLSASGLPSGASASFSPASGTPAFSSTMTITTSTLTGTYMVTIKSAYGSVERTAAYMLTISPATYMVSFQILDDDGSPVSGATLNFAGLSYSHGESASAAAGSHSLSAGDIPSGYRFSQWEAGGSVSVSSSTSSSTTATVSGAGSITMRLQRMEAVTFSVSGMGSDASEIVLTVDGVGYSHSQLPKSFIWNVGSSHSFTWADPVSGDVGVRYIWLSASGLSSAKSGTITVPSGGGSVTADYQAQVKLTIEVSPVGGGITDPAPGEYWHNVLDTVTVTASANSGYIFDHWERDGVNVGSDNPYMFSISYPSTLTAVFASTTATVTFSASGLSPDVSGMVLVVDGVSHSYLSLPLTFNWEIGSTHSFTWSDPVSAGSGKRYIWVSTSGLSTAKSGSITVPVGGGSVAAAYKTQYYLTMQYSPSGGGSVSPSSGWRDAGSSVTISASPSSGWAFEVWVGSGLGSYSGTSSSRTITINGPITENAYFYTFTIDVSPSSGGCQQGESVSAAVTVTLIGGCSSTVTVSLSASGLPNGASASFNPSSVTVSPSSRTASSTMTISTSFSFDFSLDSSAGSLSICRGADKTLTFYVYDESSGTPAGAHSVTVSGSGGGLTKSGGYSLTVMEASRPTVSLSAFSNKGGLSFSFSPSSGAPYFSSMLSISASTSATLGAHAVTVTGSGGSLTRTVTVAVYVNDFSISISPSSGSVEKPASGSTSTTATVTVTSLSGSGSSQTVSLSISNVPSGASVSFSPSSVTVSSGGSATSTMTITLSSSASAGTYTIMVKGLSNCGGEETATYTLTISQPLDFSVSVNPTSLSLCRGASKTASVTVTLISGSGTVSLSASSLPSGVTVSFSPSSGSPTFTGTLTLSASSSASLGSFTVTITGSGGEVARSTTLTLHVNDFSASVSPSSGTVNAPLSGSASTTAMVTVTSASWSGGSQTVSLSASTPSGMSVSFNPSSLTVSSGGSASSTMTITVSASAVSGSHMITVTAAGDCGGSKTATYTLNIRTPILFYAQFQWHGSYYDVYTGVPGDQSYWYGKNILSIDWIPYDSSSFNMHYSSSYGIYALAVWKDSGSICQYEWYSIIYYDKSSYISGLDEQYPWSFTDGYVSSRTGTFTVPARSGSNPVIIRARYDRQIFIHAEFRPTQTESSPYTAGSISASGSTSVSDWYWESAQFTASANSGYRFGEWHKNRDYSSVYSTSNPTRPLDPMVLTADFYPLIDVYVKNYDDAPLPGTEVYMEGEWVAADSSSHAKHYIHPYSSIQLDLHNPTSYSYGGKTYTLKYYKWSDGSSSTSRTINNIVKPTSLTAIYNSVFLFENTGYSWEVYGWIGNIYVEAWGYVKNIYGEPVAGANTWAKFTIRSGYGPWIYVRAPPSGYGATNPQGYFYIANEGEETLPGNTHQLLAIRYAAQCEGYNDERGNNLLTIVIGDKDWAPDP